MKYILKGVDPFYQTDQQNYDAFIAVVLAGAVFKTDVSQRDRQHQSCRQNPGIIILAVAVFLDDVRRLKLTDSVTANGQH